MNSFIFYVKDTDNKVFAIAMSRRSLIVWQRHEGKEQLFKVIKLGPPLRVAFEAKIGECLTYNQHWAKFRRSDCDTNENYKDQEFMIVYQPNEEDKKEESSSEVTEEETSTDEISEEILLRRDQAKEKQLKQL